MGADYPTRQDCLDKFLVPGTQLDAANQLLGKSVLALMRIASSLDVDATALRKMASTAVDDLLATSSGLSRRAADRAALVAGDTDG